MNRGNMTKIFCYCIGDAVKVACSGERGTVIARAEYESGDDQYHVRLRCGDGCAREVWWARSAILFDDVGTPNPMDGVELKANTGGCGGVDEAKPAVAEDDSIPY